MIKEEECEEDDGQSHHAESRRPSQRGSSGISRRVMDLDIHSINEEVEDDVASELSVQNKVEKEAQNNDDESSLEDEIGDEEDISPKETKANPLSNVRRAWTDRNVLFKHSCTLN